MPNSNILMYTTEDGLTKIEATFENDTVWLSIDQMAELFQRDRSVIGKHVRNIFKEGELDKNLVWAKFAYTASDGKDYNVDYYNLDVIISVGYRVKSLRGTQFRIWATDILKEYIKKVLPWMTIASNVWVEAITLKNCYRELEIYVHLRRSFGEKCLRYMQQALIIILIRKSLLFF